MLTCNREFSLYLNDRLWLTGEHEHAEENELVGNEVRNFFLPHVKKKKKIVFYLFYSYNIISLFNEVLRSCCDCLDNYSLVSNDYSNESDDDSDHHHQ